MYLKKNVTRFSKTLAHDILRQAHSARTAHGSTGICSFSKEMTRSSSAPAI